MSGKLDAEIEVDNPKGMGFFRLVTSVITLIIGGGVFSLSGDMAANGADGASILTAWAISGVGVVCLVLTFFALSRVKPKLKGGIFSYADAGFGPVLGFSSAWGYWISALLCTVSFSALLFSALAYFFPIFGEGNNLASIVVASIIIWFYVWLVSRGVTEAAGVNAVITISKLVPIFVAIVAIIFLGSFKPDIFIENLNSGAIEGLSFFDKTTAALMTTMWVFIGVEGAVAISGRARRDKDVGKATIVAFICVLTIYLLVSLLSLGVMPIADLAELKNPPLAGVMEVAVGPWGALLINLGVSLSLIGAMLGYTVLASESPYEAAVQGAFPKAFAKVNKKDAPIFTLILTNVIIEIFLITLMFSDKTYQFFYVLSAGMILLPYLMSSAYLIKLALTEPEAFKGKVGAPSQFYVVVGIIGVLYGLLLSYASGAVGLTIMSFLYAPGLLVYWKARSEQGKPFFSSTIDKVAVAVILLALVVSIYFMVTGQVSW